MTTRTIPGVAVQVSLLLLLPQLASACIVDWSTRSRKDGGQLEDGSVIGVDDSDASDGADVDSDGGFDGDDADVDSGVGSELEPAHCEEAGTEPPCACASGWTGERCELRETPGALTLASLTVTDGVLWPRFSPDVHEYHVLLGVGQSALALSATASDPTATTLALDGQPFVGSTAMRGMSLFGDKMVELTVSNGDGADVTYSLVAVRSLARHQTLTSSSTTSSFGGYHSVELMSKLYPEVGAVALRGNALAVGSPGAGVVSLYARTLGVWAPVSGDGTISMGTGTATEKPNFGAAVALSDEWIVVGDPRLVTRPDDPTYTGAAYVFARTESGYERGVFDMLRRPAEGTADMYGGAVAIEGSLIAVGASGYSNGAGGFGAVFIFRYDEPTRRWVQVQILQASSPSSGSFGSRIALEDGVLVVVDDLVVTGQDVASRDAHGLAHIYRLAGGTFAFEQTIGAASANVAGYFASGVALSEGRLAISERRWCLYRPCLGRPVIHVYERVANNWIETGSAKLPDEFVASVTLEPRDFGATGFGFHGRTILVAAEDEGSGLTGLNSPTTPAAQTAERRLGSVYVFDERDDGWQFSARLGPDMLNPNSPPGGFGRNIAFEGDNLALVSMYASDNTDDTQTVPLGQVHLYGLDCARVPAGAATTAGCSAK